MKFISKSKSKALFERFNLFKYGYSESIKCIEEYLFLYLIVLGPLGFNMTSKGRTWRCSSGNNPALISLVNSSTLKIRFFHISNLDYFSGIGPRAQAVQWTLRQRCQSHQDQIKKVSTRIRDSHTAAPHWSVPTSQ